MGSPPAPRGQSPGRPLRWMATSPARANRTPPTGRLTVTTSRPPAEMYPYQEKDSTEGWQRLWSFRVVFRPLTDIDGRSSLGDSAPRRPGDGLTRPRSSTPAVFSAPLTAPRPTPQQKSHTESGRSQVLGQRPTSRSSSGSGASASNGPVGVQVSGMATGNGPAPRGSWGRRRSHPGESGPHQQRHYIVHLVRIVPSPFTTTTVPDVPPPRRSPTSHGLNLLGHDSRRSWCRPRTAPTRRGPW